MKPKEHVIHITVAYVIPSTTEGEAIEKALALFNKHELQSDAHVSFIYTLKGHNLRVEASEIQGLSVPGPTTWPNWGSMG